MRIKMFAFALVFVPVAVAGPFELTRAAAKPASPVCDAAVIQTGTSTLVNRPSTDCFGKPAV